MGTPVNGTSDNLNPQETPAVYGNSEIYNGVRGVTSAEFHGAVVGVSTNSSLNPGPGVYGDSNGAGVWGNSHKWHGVAGISDSSTGGAGIYGKGRIAALFDGPVEVRYGNLNIQGGLLQMNGVDIWALIQDLQKKVNRLELELRVVNGTANQALTSAQSANSTANAALAAANRR